MPCAWPVTPDMKNPAHHPRARDVARYVGDAVAVLVADSKAAAEDGVAAVVVDYDALTPVIALEDARSDSTVIHPELGHQHSYVWTLAPRPTRPCVDARSPPPPTWSRVGTSSSG